MLLIIDGNSLAHRSYHGFLRSVDLHGRGAIYGFYHNLLNLASEYKPTHLAVCWDSDQPTWRHKKYPEYKAGRDEKPGELVAQIAKIKEGLKLMGVAQLEYPGWEADDWIGSLAWSFIIPGHNNLKIYIYSSDKDLFQLVCHYIKILVPVDQKMMEFGVQEVRDKLGVDPSQVVDYKALAGDQSDNLPGVSGIGPKKAVSLLEKYENLGQIYEHLDYIDSGTKKKLTEGKEKAFLCRHLARIITDIPIPDIDFSLKPPAFNQMSDYFREIRLSKLSEKVSMSLGYLYKKPVPAVKIVES